MGAADPARPSRLCLLLGPLCRLTTPTAGTGSRPGASTSRLGL